MIAAAVGVGTTGLLLTLITDRPEKTASAIAAVTRCTRAGDSGLHPRDRFPRDKPGGMTLR